MKKLALLVALTLAGCSAHAQSAVVPAPQAPSMSGDAVTGWKQFPLGTQFAYAFPMLGHDGQIYGEASGGVGIVKIDTSGNETVLQTNGCCTGGQSVTPNPDGDTYAVLSNSIAQVDPLGNITYYPLPFQDNFGGMTTGSDQNLWILHDAGIGRMTPQGQYAEFGGGPFVNQYASISRGPDKNIWVSTYQAPNNVLIQVAVATGKETVFQAPSDLQDLVQGTDQNLYAAGSTGVYQVNMDGTTTLLPASPNPSSHMVAGQGRLWWHRMHSGIDHMYGWSVKKHKVNQFITAPQPIVFWQFGADKNLWTFSGPTVNVLVFPTPGPSPSPSASP